MYLLKSSNFKKFSLILITIFLLLIMSACGSESVSVSVSGSESESEAVGKEYPTKPINAIVPWSAGGGSDIAFRGYVNYVAEELGQNINVKNVTGGNGAIGWAEAAGTSPDGYNLSLLTFDVLTNEALGVSANSYEDFKIINMFTIQGMLLITHSDFEWKTLDEFLEAAKAAKENGKPLTIGTNGDYGLWHQAGVLMEEATGTEGLFTYVPLPGSAEQNSELLGKHLDAIISSPTASLGYIEEGSMIGLASMTSERLSALPDTPTFNELGYDVQYESWRALAVPKDTPDAVVEKLEEAGKAAYDDPKFQEWATKTNIDQMYLDSEESKTYLEKLYPKVKSVIEKFGL